MLRILIIYQSKPDIVSGLARGLTNCGADALCFLADQHHHWLDKYVFHAINKWAHNLRVLKKGKFLFTNHRLNHWNYLNNKLVEFYIETKPDAVLFIHGIHYSNHTLAQITCPKIGWLVDPVTNPERLFLFASKLDWYFSYSQTAIHALNQLGFSNTSYLSHAVDHQQFFPIVPLNKSIDIAFVGKHSTHREKFILAALEVTKKVSVYGSRWIAPAFKHPSLFFAIKGFQCYGHKLNRLYNSSQIVLSIIAKPQAAASLESGINMRPYEILATGALLFSDQYDELHPELIHHHNLVLINSVEEFKVLLHSLLKDSLEIERIATNGQKFIKNRFSYEAMAAIILDQLKMLSLSLLK
jgi:hypothetical protein